VRHADKSIVVLVLVLVGSGVAHGETPLYVSAGVGLGQGRMEDYSGEAHTKFGPGFQIDLGYRLRRTAAVGVHLAISQAAYKEYDNRAMFDTTTEYKLLPIQLGIAGHFVLADRVSFAPWIGFQDRVERESCTTTFAAGGGGFHGCSDESDYQATHQPAFGLTVAADVSVKQKHRFAVFLSLSRAMGSEDDLPYTGVWAGLGYRYW
jgi:hypothetical protein